MNLFQKLRKSYFVFILFPWNTLEAAIKFSIYCPRIYINSKTPQKVNGDFGKKDKLRNATDEIPLRIKFLDTYIQY